MKARFFALAALVLGLASCQNDFDSANVGVGGEVDFQLAVSAPEFGATRADGDLDEDGNNKNGYNSAYGAIDYLLETDWESVDLRYSLEVYDYDPATKTIGDAPVKDRMVKVLDKYEPVVFELRLVPGRNYHFVVFADFVNENATETPTVAAQANIGKHHVIGNTLAAITLKDDAINTELTDAYFATDQFEITNSAAKNMTLRRPYGKVRVVATDLAELNLNVEATSVKVTYTAANANKFNAVDGTITGEGATTFEATYNVATDTYSEYTVGYDDDTTTALNGTVRKSHMTLSTDYILAVDEQKPIQFSIEVFDQNGQPIKETVFSTDIPVQRNYLTTVIGNVLTTGTEINISIDDDFYNADNIEGAPYYQVAVTNGVELVKALYEGREIIVLNDITVTAADVEAYLATTRANAAINPVLNLNGFTITIENNGNDALVDLNGGVLTVEGEGAIESTATAGATAGALVETIYNVGEATIANNAATEPVVNCLSEIRAAFANGGEYTMVCDFAISESLTLATGKELVFDLNGKTLTGRDSATGSFGLITNQGTLTVKNGTITLVAENNREWNAYSSVISNNPGGNLTVENVTLEHFGGTDMAYGIDNLTNGKGTYAETTVNNGAVVKSPYRAIRQFLNGIEAQNILTVNAGAIVEGANKSIWMQDPSANANTGKLVVNEGATLKGDVYLFVCAGSTSWPVEVSIAASAVNGEVLTGNVPAGYDVVEENGVWVVKAYEVVANGLYKKDAKTYLVMNAEGLAALNAMMVNKTAGTAVKVTLGADIDFADKTWTPVDSHVDSPFYFSELDGNGYTISNLTINGQAMFTRFAGTGNVTIKNVTFDNAKVNSNGNLNTSILTVQTYQNVLLDNVDVKNSTIIGGYKVAPLIATVYNESSSTITATLKNCDVENTVVKATTYDFCTAGMVAFVYEGDNDRILFENCSVKDVQLYAPNSYTAHAAIYTAGSETLYNEVEGVVVENVTFENI